MIDVAISFDQAQEPRIMHASTAKRPRMPAQRAYPRNPIIAIRKLLLRNHILRLSLHRDAQELPKVSADKSGNFADASLAGVFLLSSPLRLGGSISTMPYCPW